jgi:pilus assembly protein CpaD
MFQAGNSGQDRRPSTGLLVLAVLSASLLAGCAKRDSITVGAFPDDYRTTTRS